MNIIKSIAGSKNTALRALNSYNNKLCIKTQKANLIIVKSEICYLNSDSNYCWIKLRDGRSIICSRTLKEINSRIGNSDFIKVHKSYVVNINDIVSLNSSYSHLTLNDGSKIPIARAQRSMVRETVNHRFD